MTEDFLWHRVSEEEKKDIQKQAKRIMNSFSGKLATVDKKIKEPMIERGDGFREEGNGEECDEKFRERLFKNAPKKDKDFIITEKKTW